MDYSGLLEDLNRAADFTTAPLMQAAAAVAGLAIVVWCVNKVVYIIRGGAEGEGQRFEEAFIESMRGRGNKAIEVDFSGGGSSSDRDGDGVGGGSPAHRIQISTGSSLSEEEQRRLFEEADAAKGRFRQGLSDNKDY